MDCPLGTTGRALLCGSYGEKPSDRRAQASGQGAHAPVAEAAKYPAQERSYDGRDDGPVTTAAIPTIAAITGPIVPRAMRPSMDGS